MEFDFLPEFDATLQSVFAANIPKWHAEVKKLLPTLPDRIDIKFDNQYLLPEKGSGGFSLSQNEIALAYDTSFRGERESQFYYLRGCYYHECYHIVQGFVGDNRSKGLSALFYAIYEGTATQFEMIRSGVVPEWGKYPNEQTITQWLNEVKTLPIGYDWRKWKIDEPNSNSRWILFSLGTYIANLALQKSKLQIESLVSKRPEEILMLAKLKI
jgi:hypothetical protein